MVMHMEGRCPYCRHKTYLIGKCGCCYCLYHKDHAYSADCVYCDHREVKTRIKKDFFLLYVFFFGRGGMQRLERIWSA